MGGKVGRGMSIEWWEDCWAEIVAVAEYASTEGTVAGGVA